MHSTHPLPQQLQPAPGALVQETEGDVKGGAAPHLQGALRTQLGGITHIISWWWHQDARAAALLQHNLLWYYVFARLNSPRWPGCVRWRGPP